jgi:L-arabinose isomerase
VVVGFWQEEETQEKIGAWARAAAAWHDWQGAKFARFGDNMREVAVTEGDKVAAQLKFGFSVNTTVSAISWSKGQRRHRQGSRRAHARSYEAKYVVAPDLKKGGQAAQIVREAARIELGMRAFLTEGGFKGFTTTFEDLHGLAIAGLVPQRLMADRLRFRWRRRLEDGGARSRDEGHGQRLLGGTSFMEDYTYHMQESGNQLVLGSHMLEICPTIADGKASLQVHPLGIGGKADPARLVFNTPAGSGINVALMDMGNRFRFLLNEVDCRRAAERPCPNCRWLRRSGNAARASRTRARAGFMRAARITPASARR